MKAFLDTNVLVYAFSAGSKRERARQCVAIGGETSVQILNEFVNVLRRKLKRDWSEIEGSLAALRRRFPVPAPISLAMHERAVQLARAHNFAFYDALVVAAALEAGCDTLLTEDMQHGRKIAGLVIENPFL